MKKRMMLLVITSLVFLTVAACSSDNTTNQTATPSHTWPQCLSGTLPLATKL